MATDMASASLSHDHAERMDRMYRYQRHIYDLTRKYYLFGRDRAIGGLHVPPGATLLEVGCGTGRNLLLAHRHYPTAKLYGLDISAEMLESAQANFRRKPVAPEFRVADATSFKAGDFGVAGFDRILISYALSMIPDWEKAIDAALAALAPSGSLHIVDFGQQEQLPGWFGRLLKAWLTRFHVTPRANLHAVLESRLSAADADMIFEEIGWGYAWHAVIRRRG
ncbi:class I SAM-dependent methyltransferase [Neorhizobium petrolearium]|uniref:Class I SAM-dependent methyltransferase n=1 Tax=Neorhizobium petrolearium TaxID=515361 RepID=A0ABY8MA90_9HYPH|nr:class I SAM-dependent methyltransferase [Neorhizobium petrolearium]MCC2610435.1 class I SAM-dependent methyltransferase [Neorhizobium petrolearium]WGI70579.1 class I SAM-dependent methyltransferase [Neorhizobium petrolearium]